MSENDKRLIEQARAMDYKDWYDINGMIAQAESEEAKARLRSIRAQKYHTEEYYAGIL